MVVNESGSVPYGAVLQPLHSGECPPSDLGQDRDSQTDQILEVFPQTRILEYASI